MIYLTKDSKIIYETDSSIGKLLCSTSDTEIINLTLAPGAMIESHQIPVKIYFYVISGSGNLIIEVEESNLNEGDVAEILSHAERSWLITTTKQLVLLGIKVK